MRNVLRTRSGVTLLELLVVLMLVSLFFGVASGFATRFTLGREAAVQQVRAALQEARALAASQGAPARVAFDAAERRVRILASRTVALWHFEEPDGTGAFGLRLEMRGARSVPDGAVGSAVGFDDGGFATLAVAGLAPWSSAAGAALEAFVRPAGGGGTVASRGATFRLEVRGDGGLRAEATTAKEDERGRARGERAVVETDPGLVPEGRWTRVGLLHDGRKLFALVDGIVRGEADAPGPLFLSDAPFSISDADRSFRGSLDEVRVSVLSEQESRALPEGADFENAGFVAFDATGALDRAFHTGIAGAALRISGGKRRFVLVGPLGVVR